MLGTMRGSRGVSWLTLLCALCTLQCADLKTFGKSCGNGALDETTEDCDGHSYTFARTAGRTVTCGTSGPSACRFVCDAKSECPSDEWACRGGICVLQSDQFGAPREVIGAASRAYTADFDNDGADDLVAVPLSSEAPLVTHFSILDAAKTTALSLFPTPASGPVTRLPGAQARALTKPGVLVAMTAGQAVLARAAARSDGTLSRKFEPVPLALSTVQASAVEFLVVEDDSGKRQPLVWVHGAAGDPDYLAKWEGSTAAIEPLRPMLPATDSQGDVVSEHRIVFGIGGTTSEPCARVGVFTRETASPSTGTLQIFAPDADCEWTKLTLVATVGGRYPATHGAGGVLVADLNGDSRADLLVNARDSAGNSADPASDQVRTYVLYGPWSNGKQYATLPYLPPNHLIMAVGRNWVTADVLTCTRSGRINEAALCVNGPGSTGPPPKFQVGLLSGGTLKEGQLVDRGVLAAGYNDFTGDGVRDIWAWFSGDTGAQVFEATKDEFFPNRLIDHGTASLRQIGSAQLDFSSAPDLVALTETKTLPPSDAGPPPPQTIESRIHVTSGRLDLAQMTSDVVARFTGRASMTIGDATSALEPGMVRLAICGSTACDEASIMSRTESPIVLAELKAIGANFFATPANLTLRQCGRLSPWGQNGVVAATEDPSPGHEDVLEVQLVAVGRESGSDVTVRWGQLREGKPATGVSCGQALIPSDSNVPIEYVALAPASSALDSWLFLMSQDTAGDGAGRAFLLAPPPAEPQDIAIERPADGYRAIYAEPHDLDGDGDTDFVVLEGKGSETTTRRPRLYVNLPCKVDSQRRCLSVKSIDGFDTASVDGVAWERSRIDARIDVRIAAGLCDAGNCDARPSRDYWFAALTRNSAIEVQRFTVTGKDGDLLVSPVGGRQGLSLKVRDAERQGLVWGDFDGDGTLELVYVSDHGSYVYRRGDAAREGR